MFLTVQNAPLDAGDDRFLRPIVITSRAGATDLDS